MEKVQYQSLNEKQPIQLSRADEVLLNLEAFRMPSPWIVFTGAPCSGKTTVIKALEQSGFQVEYEIAEALRSELVRQQQAFEPWRANPSEFTLQVLSAKVARENSVAKSEVIFWDRALPDTLLFCELNSVEMRSSSLEKLTSRYRKVLLFEALEFEASAFRDKSDQFKQKEMEEKFEEIYRSLGYEIIPIPVMPLESRVSAVLEAAGILI